MNDNKVVKQSTITLGVGLDKDNQPAHLEWTSTDGPAEVQNQPQACKAALLSFFTRQEKETLKIDLWTNDMQVVEMDRFFYQTLRSMADTYYRATQNQELANDFQQFVFYFGQKTGTIPKQDPAK